MSASYEQRREAFERFHSENPQVFERLVHFARQARRAGRERLGMRLLIERIRWEWSVELQRTDEFRINDHHAPFYARLIAEVHPNLAHLFETRDRDEPEPYREPHQDELFGGAA